MPTREAIVNNIIPQDVPKPIPVRTVTTRPRLKPAAAPAAVPAQNGNQPNNVVTPAAAVPATTEETVKLGPAASALARKEQAFRQREQAFKAEQEKFAAYKEKAEKYEQLTQKLSAKDYSEAEKLGLNYEEYFQYKVNQTNGEDPTLKKISALEQQIADLKKGQEENAEQSYEATVGEYRKEVSQLISTNAEFSPLKKLGKEAEEAALQLILDSWEEEEIEVTPEQACRDIQKEILETAKKYSELIETKPAPVVEEPQTPRPMVNTITNQMQPPSGEQRHQKSLQHLSENERYAEARRRALAKRAAQQGT